MSRCRSQREELWPFSEKNGPPPWRREGSSYETIHARTDTRLFVAPKHTHTSIKQVPHVTILVLIMFFSFLGTRDRLVERHDALPTRVKARHDASRHDPRGCGRTEGPGDRFWPPPVPSDPPVYMRIRHRGAARRQTASGDAGRVASERSPPAILAPMGRPASISGRRFFAASHGYWSVEVDE